jgi:hypothetical protein
VDNININLPTLGDVGMRHIIWVCTDCSILNISFILDYCLSTSACNSNSMRNSDNNLSGITENKSTNSLNIYPLQADNENYGKDNAIGFY